MRKKNYKGRCQKRVLSKCERICKTYDEIQSKFADKLQKDKEIQKFICNFPLDGLDYTTDFVATKANKDLFVRECVNRNFLTKPMTVKLLDISREYWLKHGVADWGIVINEE